MQDEHLAKNDDTDIDSLAMSDENLRAIGQVVVDFQRLELRIAQLAGGLVPTGGRLGEMLTAELSFKQLKFLARTLYLEHFGEDEIWKRLQEALKKSQKLEESRNTVVHSVWLSDYRHKTKAKSRFMSEVEEHPDPSKLIEIARRCRALAEEFAAIHSELGIMGKLGHRLAR